MGLMRFPFERVIEINAQILETEPGMKGAADVGKLQGALGRVDNSILYDDLDDLFEIAAKYADSISSAHALPDANKRTALAVAIEFLSFNDFDLSDDNDLLADALRDLVLGKLSVVDFADILYAQYAQDNSL